MRGHILPQLLDECGVALYESMFYLLSTKGINIHCIFPGRNG